MPIKEKEKKKKNINSYLTMYKINPKWIIDLNVKPKIIKVLEKNMDKSLCDLELAKVS